MDRHENALHKLGRRLTRLREERQLTIPALATLTGLDPRDITAIEAGEIDPQLTTIFALGRALGVKPDQLLSLEE
jgi:transcriptional regulator with XRE-family HTH domain